MSEESVRCSQFGLGGQVWEIEGNYLLMISIGEAIKCSVAERMIDSFRPRAEVGIYLSATLLGEDNSAIQAIIIGY